MHTPSFIEQTIETWLAITVDIPAVAELSTIQRSSDATKAAIEIETSTHLGLIEIWEHANCLDTTIHESGQPRGLILAEGPSSDDSVTHQRLRQLRDALFGNLIVTP
jgi:hypothetical protein